MDQVPVERLRSVVGMRTRELRESAGLRLQDVSDALQGLGVRWMPTQVAAFERGARAVGIEDLVVLAAGLGRATGRTVTVLDLVRGDGQVAVHEGVSISVEDLAGVLTGGADAAASLIVDEVVGPQRRRERDPQAVTVAGALGWPSDSSMRWGRALYIERHFSDADQRAARRIGLSPAAFAVLCLDRWGRSMTAERDRRLAADLDLGSAEAATMAARRGRASRELLAEAQTALEAGGFAAPAEPA